MKKTFTFCFFLITAFSLFAQNEPKGFHLEKRVNMAAVLSSKPSIASGFSTISEARTTINDIMEVVGEQQNFKVLSTTQVDNAAAVVYQGQRYILYNPSFINKLDNVANDKWASISVVAHEIGHHLLGHTLDGRGSQIPKELGADEFSGAVLKRMGATLQQSQLAMQLISSPYASATHPGQKDRLAAISKGWNGSSIAHTNNERDIAIGYPTDNRRNGSTGYPDNRRRDYPTYPSNNRTSYPDSRRYPENSNSYPSRGRNSSTTYPGRRNTNSNNQSIVYDVKFKSSNGQQYFITSQNNVIMYNGNRVYVVAKIANTNRANYPYVIYDDNQQLLVDRRGNIFNESGRNVGYITPHA